MNIPSYRKPSPLTRRRFLGNAAAITAATGLSGITSPMSFAAADAPSRKVILGVMGVSRTSNGGDGRGSELAKGFATLPGVQVAYVCDVDERHLGKAVEGVAAKQGTAPKGVRNFQQILDDPAVDGIVIATPDHWHAPATILACAAKKHVYVEKPASHNPREGELMLAAARKHQRVVQLGTQRRTWPAIVEAVEKLHAGEIGRVLAARCFYFNARPTIGHGVEAAPPATLDYSLWQGPAPERPFRDNLHPYNWHWFWHWGTGELGNNGIHFLDVARWGLGVDYPSRIVSSGGKYRYDDDQETPDSNLVTFEFGDKMISWENRSWSKRTALDPDYDIAFQGEKGTLLIRGSGYVIHDLDGKEKTKQTGPGGNQGHLQNFVDSIRNGTRPNAEIEEGVRSTLMCHLGNISYRTGRAVWFDGKSQQIVADLDASGQWRREYRKGWEPKV